MIIGLEMAYDKGNIWAAYCCFNSGVLLIRNSKQGRKFIQAINNDLPKPLLNVYKNYKNKCNLSPAPGGVIAVDSTINSLTPKILL